MTDRTEPRGRQEILAQLERELGLRAGFIENLRREDDWSFVIKSHALIEGAVAHVLVKAVDRDELALPFASLNMTAKVKFAAALGLLDTRAVRFIEAFSTLRNRLVHNVAHLQEFQLEAHFAESLPADLKARGPVVLRWVLYVDDDDDMKADGESPDGDFRVMFFRAPKIFLLMSVKMLIVLAYREGSIQHSNRRYRPLFKGWSSSLGPTIGEMLRGEG